MLSKPIQRSRFTQPEQHEGTEHLAIKNTFFRRSVTLLALKTTARFYKCEGPCVPISKSLIVKTGPLCHLTEPASMTFIASNTSIPVPRVHCSFVHNGWAFIVMDRVKGDNQAWNTASDSDLDTIFKQLRGMIDEMRALRPAPGTGVQSCVGGSLRDSRIPRREYRFGPFRAVNDFHLWLRRGFNPAEVKERANNITSDEWKDVIDMAAEQDKPWSSVVFTHGDLNPFNILIRGDQVAGIIDWEFAGWYPPYWEYTSAWRGNLTRARWQEDLPRFLEQYPSELKMEITRQHGGVIFSTRVLYRLLQAFWPVRRLKHGLCRDAK